MKIEIKPEEKTISKSYPYIGKHKGHGDLIVFFTDPKRGFCLNAGDTDNKIGDYAKYWSERDFVHFYGTITISND